MTNEQLVEQIARQFAAHMEGGREFDQMPPDRIALRKWSREGMCNVNDATRADALEAAEAILPIILAAREEGARAMQEACAMAYENEAETWVQITQRGSCVRQGLRVIRALDPAKIAGGSDEL